jgi:hypothetical protein
MSGTRAWAVTQGSSTCPETTLSQVPPTEPNNTAPVQRPRQLSPDACMDRPADHIDMSSLRFPILREACLVAVSSNELNIC